MGGALCFLGRTRERLTFFWPDFFRVDAGTMGSNPTHCMDVLCLCCVCVFLCLCTPIEGVLPTVQDLETEVKLKVPRRRSKPGLGCRDKDTKKKTKKKQYSARSGNCSQDLVKDAIYCEK
jgi:hypothetical protein